MSETPQDYLVGKEIDTVSFVRDFVELRIDHSILRVLTRPTGTVDGMAWRFDEPGAADTMRRYIGKWVVAVELDDERLSLVLDGGGTFDVSFRKEDSVGPEAAHLVPAAPDGSLDAARMWIW